ncbi:25 kDa integral membrane protein [Schistosoma japonicum]|nr:25 kDa integral membrane protein [Schistosoma japonicum]KAH8849318.1 25 kDa integral membrane protein [Schistosoma japonicum]
MKIFSIILLVLGSTAQTILSKFNTILQNPAPVIFLIVIFTGSFGLLSAFIGYIGLWKPMNLIALLFYAATNHSLLNAVKFFYAKPQYEIELDQLQTDFKCCGAKSYMDYRKLAVNIPFTCLVGHLVYARGCIEVLSDYIQQYIIVMISLCFIFSIIQGVYLIISILMFNRSVDKKNCFT